MRKFNSDFLIGAATSAHQVEGNNINSDCWLMENLPGSIYKEKSMESVDHYNRFREDIKILADAGLNSYRFSIEWARIEPEKGSFSSKEIEHYREVLNCCYENSVVPIVTLHHFSSPVWLISEGGWENEATVKHFTDYCRYVVYGLGEHLRYVCTINEANMGLQISKIAQAFMTKSNIKPDDSTKSSDVQVGLNIIDKQKTLEYYEALGVAFGLPSDQVHVFLAPRSAHGDRIVMMCHEQARKAIKEIYPSIKVGITFSLYDHQALPGGEEKLAKEQSDDFLHYLPYIQDDDFLGVQNYTRKIHGPNGIIKPDKTTRLTEIGNEFYPEALGGVLRFVAQHWRKPIIVTENGISTGNDKDRIEFIQRAIEALYQCMEDGIEVGGYMHWSLLDNFEWQLGFAQKFGLVAVDRSTQKRYPKESLTFLGNIRKNGF